MKRLGLTVVVVLLAVCFGLAGALAVNKLLPNEDDSIKFAWDKVRVAHENMYPDNFEYVDYAEEVKFDYDKYPLLENQGLFWLKWDDASNSYIKIDADTAEGASLVDPSKPTIINIHGMLVEGYYTEEMYWMPEDSTTSEEIGYDMPVQTFKFWFDKGYNVGMYSYQKFAAEGISYNSIEEKMWATNGEIGIRYQKPDTTYDEDVSEYTITEHFAADYIRAMKLLPDNFGDKEIRFAAHSMGGQMVTGGTFLLTELASVGQLNPNQLPDRICMEDTFFGAFIDMGDNVLYAGTRGLILRWSGKPLPNDTTGETVIECLKDIAANGVVFEYYSYDASFLRSAQKKQMKKDLIDNSVYIVMDPKFASNEHCGVRDFYLTSILVDYDSSLELTDAEKVAYAASLPTEELRALVGKCFRVQEGQTTIMPNDDVYIEATSQYYPAN